MQIDEYDFEQTAQAVFIMNRSAQERHADWEALKEFMISMAYTYCFKNCSFATGGYVLTAYDGLNGERVVRASVQAFTALMYIKERG